MNFLEALQARHSVRSYQKTVIEAAHAAVLLETMETYNRESGLSLQLCLNEPRAFDSIFARYGVFFNVNNYIALVGKKNDEAAQACGYYGEKLVLEAQLLGLNTCWVGGTFSRRKAVAQKRLGEKLHLVIACGYGESQGKPHRTKAIEELSSVAGAMPDWFVAAMEAVQLAPTAMNQQKFLFGLEKLNSEEGIKSGYLVKAETKNGVYTQVDLGIAKCHFEIGAEAAGAALGTTWNWA